jgi:DNA-binding transcriptional MerR regulator
MQYALNFSHFSGVSQSTLRYYDEIGLLPPASRGENNYRYYLPFQLITLKFIEVLSELGVPLSVIKELSGHRTPRGIIELLNRQQTVLDRRFHELRTLYSIIHTVNGNIEDGMAAKDKEISVKYFEPAVMLLGKPNDYSNERTYFDAFIDFCDTAEENRINLKFPIGGYYRDINSFRDSTGKPDRFFSQDPMGNVARISGNYIVAYVTGYYSLSDSGLADRIENHARERNLECTGPVFSSFIINEICMPEQKNFVSRTMVAVIDKKEKRRY